MRAYSECFVFFKIEYQHSTMLTWKGSDSIFKYLDIIVETYGQFKEFNHA